MSVNLKSRRNVVILIALILGTIVGVVGGLTLYDGPVIEEVLLVTIVLLVAVILYDKILVM